MSKIDRLKQHFEDHGTAYIVGGVCLITGTIIGVRLKNSALTSSLDVAPKILQILSWKPNATQEVTINLIERSIPSKPVHLVGTNLYFDSLNEAARQTGHSLSQISKNVNGKINNVAGDIFEFITIS